MDALKSIQSLFKSKSTDKFYTVSGKATFQVEVKITGNSPYCNCVLSVHAFNNLENRIAIAAQYKWYRVYNLARMEVKASGNSYHASALDIGSKIMVDIIPMAEEGENGIATVEFGPIILDPSMKATLQGILRSGGTKFTVEKLGTVNSSIDMRGSTMSRQSGHHGSVSSESSGSIVLFKNNFRIVKDTGDHNHDTMNTSSSGHGFTINLGEKYDLQTGLGPTSVTLTLIDEQRNRQLEKSFGGTMKSQAEIKNSRSYSQNKLSLTFNSKTTRDLFLMSVRCFEA